MTRIRCRNCGLWHSTQICPSFGPMFPAPGKDKSDYASVEREIQRRLAQDIVDEHNGAEGTEGEIIHIKRPYRRKKQKGSEETVEGSTPSPAA